MFAVCAGMFRSASTWQYQIVSEMVEKYLGGKRLGYLRPDSAWAVENERQTRKWMAVKVHSPLEPCAERFLADGRAKVFYIHRDVRDVIYSLVQKRATTFGALIQEKMIEQLLFNDKFWRAQPTVLVQRYDEVLSEPVLGVAAIGRHLGLRLGMEEIERLTTSCSLNENKRRASDLEAYLRVKGIDLNDPKHASIGDPGTQIHWNHIREARVNHWKDIATPEELAILDIRCGEWLRANGYETSEVRSLRKQT